MPYRRIFLSMAVIILAVLSVVPAFAANTMTVTPIWRPGQQLTTLVADGDFRYVDVELLLTGNVQFWAVNVGCTFTPSVLEGYTFDSGGGTTPSDPGDDVPMVTWGPEWGASGTEFIAVATTPGQNFDYNPATGLLSLRATRLGSVTPLGINGASYNLLLATLRLRVRDQGSTFRTVTATVKCAPMSFLDRDGRVVVSGKQSATAALTARTGYTISGTVLLQGAKAHTGTQVQCTNTAPDPDVIYTTTTTSTGAFNFGGTSQLIRELGRYTCTFVSAIISPRSEFLDAQVAVDLNTPSFYLLPVVLKGGNVAVGAGSENDIDDTDLGIFTSTWATGPVTPAYTGRDVNGDSVVNEADLAMFAGNYDPQATLFNVDASHILYGLAINYGGVFPNSRVYWGSPLIETLQLVEEPKAERDFWPAMSPDGTRIAFSRLISKTGKYILYTSPTSKPKGAQLTPKSGFTDDALAPSWSPDGQRIAFICTRKGTSDGLEYNDGDLCIINANGTNLQVIAQDVRIYPPAWFNNTVLIYGATDNHSITQCRNTLCFIDLATNFAGRVSANLQGTTRDMPAVSSFDFDANPATPNDPVLFYRWNNGSALQIAAARVLSYNSVTGVFDINATFPGAQHASAALPSSAQTDVEYYSVSPFMDVIYYESTIVNSRFQTTDLFYVRRYGDTTDLQTWAAPVTYRVDGFVGNNTSTGGLTPGLPWDGGSGATVFHAQRATVQWIP